MRLSSRSLTELRVLLFVERRFKTSILFGLVSGKIAPCVQEKAVPEFMLDSLINSLFKAFIGDSG